MKNRAGVFAYAAMIVLASSRPAAAKCHWYDIICGISNEIDCGHWGSCGNSSSSSNTGTTSAALRSSPPPPAPPPANTGSGTNGTGGSGSTASRGGPSGPLVVPKPVASPAVANANNNNASGSSLSSALSANANNNNAAPAAAAPKNQTGIYGGAAPTPSGGDAPNTLDAPVAAHSLVALNVNASAGDYGKLAGGGYTEAGAHPALINNAAANLGALQGGGVKPQAEVNIYKTVGAIEDAGAAKNKQGQLMELTKNMMGKLQMKDWDGVVDAASALIKADPTNAWAFARRAEAYNHLKNWAQAEQDAAEAVRLDPSNEQAWKQLAWAQLRQGKFREAMESASHAIALNPHDGEAYMMRAYARDGLGDHQGMLDDVRMAAAFDSRFKDAYARALAGERLWNPDEDDDALLGIATTATRHRPAPLLPLAGLGVLLAALVGGGWGLKRLLAARRAAKTAAADAAFTAKIATASPAAAEVKRFTPGSIIGKYQLGRVVGRGGMGQIFEATDLSLGRPVAVKKMTEQVAQLGPQARALFLKEARTVAQLHHPTIVEIYEILEEGQDLFMVFELLSGKTAQQILAESGRVGLARVVQLLRPVCEALDFAHGRALVHRDLKPGNIMVTDQGHVKLMDFGIARSLEEAGSPAPAPAGTAGAGTGGFARTNIVAGTAEYRPPEAELGVICKEGDVYSLGVTAYELLTGRLPYSLMSSAEDKATQRFARASALAPGLPAAVDELLSKALQASPERRLKTPGEFIAALEAAAVPKA